MDLKVDIGEILAGVAAVLSAWAALKERGKKSPPPPPSENLPNNSAAKSPKSSIGQVPSDSGAMRLVELLGLSEQEGER